MECGGRHLYKVVYAPIRDQYLLRMPLLTFIVLSVVTFAVDSFNSTESIPRSPYQVNILDAKYFVGGGALIKSDVVITAASLIEKRDWTLFVRAGSNLCKGGYQRRVIENLLHPAYNLKLRKENNLALLFLYKPFELRSSIQALNLPETPVLEASTLIINKVNATGYRNEVWSEKCYIHTWKTEIIPKVICERMYPKLSRNMLCAGDLDNPSNRHPYAVGNPLVANGTLVGIAAGCSSCNHNLFPLLYMNITHYREWIVKSIDSWTIYKSYKLPHTKPTISAEIEQ